MPRERERENRKQTNIVGSLMHAGECQNKNGCEPQTCGSEVES